MEEWKENQRIRGEQIVYLTWLMAFKNVMILEKMIQENNEFVLEPLKNIKSKFWGWGTNELHYRVYL